MYPRWNTDLNDINNFLRVLDEILESVEIPKNKRGRPTKIPKKEYLRLIIVKEWKKRSLRSMEIDYSDLICNQRVDHSVIHYQEKTMPKELIEEIISTIGQKLDNSIDYDYTFIDALNSLHGIKADNVPFIL